MERDYHELHYDTLRRDLDMDDSRALALQALAKSNDDLYFEIGSAVSGKAALPRSTKELIGTGVEWFNLKREGIALTVCGSKSLREFARQDVPTHELVVAISGILDLSSHALGGPPVVTVAVLIVRLGLHQFCSKVWESKPI